MAEGRIKDPDGRQVKPSWGYIQRTDSVSESSPPVNTNWPDTLQPKVIPFFNDGSWKFGQKVFFDVTPTTLIDPNDSERSAPLAVAYNLAATLEAYENKKN